MIENPTAKLKPILDEAFKFQVGDRVWFAANYAADTAEVEINPGYKHLKFTATSTKAPLPMIVVERTVQECHGGVQLYYACRGMGLSSDGHVSSRAERYHEFELVSFDEAVAQRKEMQAARIPEEKA